MQKIRHSTSYTLSVYRLLRSIQDTNSAETLYGQAADYFLHADADRAKLTHFEEQIAHAEEELKAGSQKQQKVLSDQIHILTKAFKNEQSRQDEKRLRRLDNAIKVCLEILSLSEGDDFEETVHKSGKFLGTVLLLSPSQSKTLSELHQRMKPAYKAVLSMRLLDQLMLDEVIKNPYILDHYDGLKRYELQDGSFAGFTQSVILPIMMAAIFQDIGLEHPESVALLKGSSNQDVFRLLLPEERQVMLKLSYKQTQDYIANGLGCQKYSGNSKQERTEFDKQEKMRLGFQQRLLKDAIVSKLGVGDIIKIPQVYASIVLSTKRNYQRKDLPKAALLIEQLADNKTVSRQAAKTFIDIVGYFPQGYGITYIPTDLRGLEAEGYEYAIVNTLYPIDPREPICRKVTRHLSYISSGSTEIIKQEYNLRFEPSRKKLSKVDKSRLIAIMQKLVHQFDPADVDNLIPTYWEPYEYFSEKKNQNLWNRST